MGQLKPNRTCVLTGCHALVLQGPAERGDPGGVERLAALLRPGSGGLMWRSAKNDPGERREGRGGLAGSGRGLLSDMWLQDGTPNMLTDENHRHDTVVLPAEQSAAPPTQQALPWTWRCRRCCSTPRACASRP